MPVLAAAMERIAAGRAIQRMAQEAAARAPDTATADAVKKDTTNSVLASDSTAGAPTARDTPANSPRHGTLTPQQESTELPKAGQVNNHSSPALEKDSGR